MIYLKNCWPPRLNSYFKSMVFPVISGLLELRKYSRKDFIFILYIFHIWMLKKFSPLPHSFPRCGYWCLRSHPSRKDFPLLTKRREAAGYKGWSPAPSDLCSFWETAAYPWTGTCCVRAFPLKSNSRRLISWLGSEHVSNRKFLKTMQNVWSTISLVIIVRATFSPFSFPEATVSSYSFQGVKVRRWVIESLFPSLGLHQF